jgi:hypothetical protein
MATSRSERRHEITQPGGDATLIWINAGQIAGVMLNHKTAGVMSSMRSHEMSLGESACLAVVVAVSFDLRVDIAVGFASLSESEMGIVVADQHQREG